MKSAFWVLECELIEGLSVKVNINRFLSKRILRKKLGRLIFYNGKISKEFSNWEKLKKCIT